MNGKNIFNKKMILVDFHVHLYRCFSLSDLFSAAVGNFQSAAEKAGIKSFTGVLCLAESKGYDLFRQLRDGRDIGEGWVCEATAEAQTLRLLARGREIYLIAGRQVNTKERVEVLALRTAGSISDGLSLADTLDQVVHLDALPVLPWGVGKWTGSRGKLVEKFLTDPERRLFPGDNGGRPYGWPEPEAFLLAARQHTAVLPGSDPLPIQTEQSRAGSYGAIIKESIDRHAPSERLMAAVRTGSNLQIYGQRVSPLTFLVRQLQLRCSSREC
jgi:hypothetical protein